MSTGSSIEPFPPPAPDARADHRHLSVLRQDEVVIRRDELTSDRVAALRRTYFKGLDDAEIDVALAVIGRTGLSPEARQIYFIKRWDPQAKRLVMQPQVSIDGFRLIAERSGKYAGQVGPWWCGRDGQWTNVWLDEEAPVAAKIGVIHRNFREPVFAVAKYDSYVQTDKDGNPTKTWRQMPDVMLAKCAESLAIRRAFPQELTEVSFSTVSADEMPADPRVEALRAMHFAASTVGMGHDQIKQFVADVTKRSLESLGSMRDWTVDQFAWVLGLIEDRGERWMANQPTAPAAATSAPTFTEIDGATVDVASGEIQEEPFGHADEAAGSGNGGGR